MLCACPANSNSHLSRVGHLLACQQVVRSVSCAFKRTHLRIPCVLLCVLASMRSPAGTQHFALLVPDAHGQLALSKSGLAHALGNPKS